MLRQKLYLYLILGFKFCYSCLIISVDTLASMNSIIIQLRVRKTKCVCGSRASEKYMQISTRIYDTNRVECGSNGFCVYCKQGKETSITTSLVWRCLTFREHGYFGNHFVVVRLASISSCYNFWHIARTTCAIWVWICRVLLVELGAYVRFIVLTKEMEAT